MLVITINVNQLKCAISKIQQLCSIQNISNFCIFPRTQKNTYTYTVVSDIFL